MRTLKRGDIEIYEACKRSKYDRMKKVSYAVVRYIDSVTGAIVRRAYEGEPYATKEEFREFIAPKTLQYN